MNDIHGVSAQAHVLSESVRQFVEREVIPLEDPSLAHKVGALEDIACRLQPLARDAGIWGPRLPREHGGLDLNWRDAQLVLEEAGRSPLGPLAMHCAPPEGPNIGTIAALASGAQRECWLVPLIEGRIRSCFAMTRTPTCRPRG